MRQTYFSTFTVQNWVSVFSDIPESNGVILDSLAYLNTNEKVIIYAFVIMRDHLHIVWEMEADKIDSVSANFKRYTGATIIKLLMSFDSPYLDNFTSEKLDRSHKFWKGKSGCLLLEHSDIIWQKITYTHDNPIKGDYKIVEEQEHYLFSSARSYSCQESLFSFLTLYT